jgi:hypothetical protein
MRLADKVFFSLIHDLFDVPIMSNLYRPEYVERLVERSLGAGFRLVSTDWAGWDIEGPMASVLRSSNPQQDKRGQNALPLRADSYPHFSWTGKILI